MDHTVMVVLVLLWSSGRTNGVSSTGLQAEETNEPNDPVRFVGGSSRCAGALAVKHGEWKLVGDSFPAWTLKEAAAVCRALDCGAAVSLARWKELLESSVWEMTPECVHSGSPLRDCVSPKSSSTFLQFTCSDSVRLVNGTSLCSGRLEVKSDQSWSSVSEEDFDQQDAEVVCRELGCGAPSDLQGALYGEAEAPTWTKEFQCGGNESALLDCRSSDRNSSSPGGAVELTCSDPVRLEGGSSRCAGTLEVKHGGEWRPVGDVDWTLKEADVFCGELDCGSAVSTGRTPASSHRPVWTLASGCVHSGAALRDCAIPGSSVNILEVTCSDLLVQPNISVSSTDGGFKAQQEGFRVSGGSKFTIICSTEPQYPGGSFLLTFSSSTSEHNYTQPAVNHSAHFLFPAAEPAHQGSYSCVYQVYIFSQNVSSESDLLSLTVSEGNVKPSQRDPVRLVGGSGRCAGTLEVKHGGEWRPVGDVDWTLKEAAVFCGELDCGSAASVGRREESPHRSVWKMTPECVHSGSALRDCVTPALSNNIVEVTCSEPSVQPM